MIKKILTAAGIMTALIAAAFTFKTLAAELDITVESSDGYSTEVLTDDNYFTTDYYMKDTTLTIKSAEDISTLYIKWDTEPGEYRLTANGADYTYGKHDFLHEYIKLPEAAQEVVITIPKDRVYIADIYAFSAGSVPDWVEIWEDPYEKADFLILSAHSDDEILFMGSIAPTYLEKGDYRIQVAYFVDFSQSGEAGVELYRRHELLDGLWTLGITHYPQLGEFTDKYSRYDLEAAEALEDMDAALSYVVRTIRRFKPQVLVTHDEEGEYGHGQHMLLSQLVKDAIEITNDASKYPESASQYGVWEVPKTYLHLYGEGVIELDARVPLSKYGGKTALEVAREAYRKHESQQWMDFLVDDGYDENGEPNGYNYSFTKFGLYRSLVGEDTQGDLMEHLTPYAVQEEEARQTTETTTAREEETTTAAPSKNEERKGNLSIWVILLIIVAALALIMIIALLAISAYKKKKKRERELARRRKIQKMREMNRRGQR